MPTRFDIASLRLANQRISRHPCRLPADLLTGLCGIQAQDYAQAKWALGVRIPGLADADVEAAIAEKKIIRSWLMRGTLGLAAAEDIRWILALLAPKIIARTGPRHRQLGLDARIFAKSRTLLRRVLRGGGAATRDELRMHFKQAGIDADGILLTHLMRQAALEQVVCFGPRRGKEFTFTLFEAWVPEGRAFPREAALAEMARRYFQSRGPATLRDFVWWSGLSAADARAGLADARPALRQTSAAGSDYWMSEIPSSVKTEKRNLFLLPGFDEYILGYADRGDVLDSAAAKHAVQRNGIFKPVIVVDGKVRGIWRPVVKRRKVGIVTSLLTELNKTQQRELDEAARAFSRFLGKSAPEAPSDP